MSMVGRRQVKGNAYRALHHGKLIGSWRWDTVVECIRSNLTFTSSIQRRLKYSFKFIPMNVLRACQVPLNLRPDHKALNIHKPNCPKIVGQEL